MLRFPITRLLSIATIIVIFMSSPRAITDPFFLKYYQVVVRTRHELLRIAIIQGYILNM